MRTLLHRRRARWAAPIAVAGAIALGSYLTTVSAGADTPKLPPLTPAQLLAKAAHPTLQGFSGTVAMTANLGLPDVSSLTSNGGQSVASTTGFDPTTLLSGTHDINVWAAGDDERLSLPSQLAETDLVRQGDQAWLWDSSTQQVTHYVGSDQHHGQQAHPHADPTPALTPEEAAQRFLDHVDPSTEVTMASPLSVAGRDAYQLAFAPKAGTPGAADSTIQQVTMDIDAQTGAVLALALHTAGTQAPALELAFTHFDPSVPSSSSFTPPTGTTTKTVVVGDHQGGDHGTRSASKPQGHQDQVTATSTPWAQVVTIHHAQLSPKALNQLDKVSTPVAAGRLIHTNVVNAIVEPDGTVVVGFVTPAVLEAAAAG